MLYSSLKIRVYHCMLHACIMQVIWAGHLGRKYAPSTSPQEAAVLRAEHCT